MHYPGTYCKSSGAWSHLTYEQMLMITIYIIKLSSLILLSINLSNFIELNYLPQSCTQKHLVLNLKSIGLSSTAFLN